MLILGVLPSSSIYLTKMMLMAMLFPFSIAREHANLTTVLLEVVAPPTRAIFFDLWFGNLDKPARDLSCSLANTSRRNQEEN